ncbi:MULTISPECIES: DUF6173 family protein [Paenibacillus]|uniref:Uncharacterized protein n=1 Tax=Paenibacillus xylanilyticus TaxID=248903 RepID=A0A7Y6ESY8_9BACL|nr:MULTISPECIES: DUF6173 family protein [Paenibacillus]MBE7683261.1 hypothetical protein [Paenibacillus sp. P13VS]NUU74006.1 hypothetical protein [Paenibacillus xylanilyticus]
MYNAEDFLPKRKNDLIGDIALASLRDPKLADNQYDILMAQIKAFEDELNESEEIAIQLASFGQSVLMNVTEIGFHNPSLMFFYGHVNGQWSQLVQHVSQLSFLITVVPKSDPNRPARRIGFIPESETPHED